MLARIEHAVTEAGIAPAATDMDYWTPRKWYALLVTPNKEREAADWLKRFTIWVYWPNFVRHMPAGPAVPGKRRKRRPVFSSVIPGYLFMAVRIEAADPWNVVHGTPGVHGFLRDAAGHAAALTDADIEIIRRIEGGLNLPPDPKTAHRFKPGDKVRFVDDIYGRWPPGAVGRLADSGRIIVDVAVLGRIVPIEVYPHQIEAI